MYICVLCYMIISQVFFNFVWNSINSTDFGNKILLIFGVLLVINPIHVIFAIFSVLFIALMILALWLKRWLEQNWSPSKPPKMVSWWRRYRRRKNRRTSPSPVVGFWWVKKSSWCSKSYKLNYNCKGTVTQNVTQHYTKFTPTWMLWEMFCRCKLLASHKQYILYMSHCGVVLCQMRCNCSLFSLFVDSF